MGEAKRRRRKQISENISIETVRDALGRLGISTGTPVSLSIVGAGLIEKEAWSGGGKLFETKATTEGRLLRLSFMSWDRIRTGEYNPWQCSLCANHHAGLSMLSAFAIIEHPRGGPDPKKPAVMALICHPCDGISREDTRGKVNKMFGLISVQEGTA